MGPNAISLRPPPATLCHTADTSNVVNPIKNIGHWCGEGVAAYMGRSVGWHLPGWQGWGSRL